ncbi:MAG TPA: sigma-70 family RNA polymerase sigma factor [Mycobacteriales bacterium]|nr:sigma-70 family RNA polymerase sigma factor [Mycobacteriales bacterium]
MSEDDSLAALVVRAQSGDGAAVEALVRELRPRVFRYVLARLLDPHAADDVTQEVAMTVTSALPRYVDQGRPVTAWVFGIAANKVREHRRVTSRRHETSVDGVPERSEDESLEPEHATMRLDTARRVAAMLATLPEQQAEIVRLRVAAGLSAEETAAVLGMTPGAVRVAQHRALARLRSTHTLDALS